jgi:hypothetical protein
MSDLLGRTLRAGTSYDLVLFDRLPPAEQVLLAELRNDPDFYGVLRPRESSGQTVRAVNRDMALLYLTLQTPGPLPFFAWEGGPDSAQRRVTELVLDGVLEIDSGGRFVAGAAALELIGAKDADTFDTRLARISRDALRYGATLGLEDPDELAGRLYAYGRQPVSPAWARRLPDRDAVLEFLHATPGSDVRRQLDSGWQRAGESEPDGWIAWSRVARRSSPKATYKLYVSPMVDALSDAFAIVVDTLSARETVRFKVGAGAMGLLRPDKLVIYFEDLETLLSVATTLTKRLDELTPHGVPFSAEISRDGLLSWGIDPPPSARIVSWQGQESWRLWLVRRLAAAIIAARHTDAPGVEPWEFAIDGLRHDGVDVERWTPSDHLWRAA